MHPLRGIEDRALSAICKLRLRYLGIEIGKAVALLGCPIVGLERDSKISIGSGSLLISRSSRTELGISHRVILRTLRPGATIRIGSDVGISGASICAATSIAIGNRVLLGADVVVADTDFHPADTVPRRYASLPEPRPEDGITIEDDVFVGARSIVLKGSVIGEGSVIGAGSVVTGEVPRGVVAAGNPCRVIRPLSI
jgi:acetyltransferase-like isoleucine patch superfamily enzyme